jgi:succinyl-CoA synthetase beta subunit
VTNGFKILLSDKNVKAVLINIFGGIVRCDRVAKGIVDALNSLNITIPVIVRLEGTNADEARQILVESPLDFKIADSLENAAQLVVDAAKNGDKR